MKQQVQQPAPVSRTLQGKAKTSCQASVADVLQAYKKDIAQRQEIEDDDELLQGKFETAQRDELEEDELLQGKFETAQRDELEDDELLQGKFETAQFDELEDDELLQKKFETAQRDELEDDELLQGKFETTQRQETPNNTGLPDNLKAGVEQLSGLDMSDVKVHYNSSKPANVQAYAYTQGTDIHVAPGQEKHLGHEAWHVAQQKQGRVQPTTTVGDIPINDNVGLEKEADVMGGKANSTSVEQSKEGSDNAFGFAPNDIMQNKLAPTFKEVNSKGPISPDSSSDLSTDSVIQRALTIGTTPGKPPIEYTSYSAKQALAYLGEVNNGQLNHPGFGVHDAKTRLEAVKTAIKSVNIRFEQVIEDRINPKTEENESYWWKVTIDGEESYFLYSYEAWLPVFDKVFGAGPAKISAGSDYPNNSSADRYGELTDKLSGSDINRFKDELVATYYSTGKNKGHVKHGSSSDSTYSKRSQLSDFLNVVDGSERDEVALAIYGNWGVYL